MQSFHSAAPGAADEYHTESECSVGRAIARAHVRIGIVAGRLCAECARRAPRGWAINSLIPAIGWTARYGKDASRRNDLPVIAWASAADGLGVHRVSGLVVHPDDPTRVAFAIEFEEFAGFASAQGPK